MVTAEALVAAVATTVGRTFTDAVTAQVTMWVGDALLQVRLRYGADRMALIPDDVLSLAVREAVASKVKSPDGLKRLQVSVDDASTTREWSTSTGQVSLDDWWDVIDQSLPDVGAARDAFSIRLGGDWW